MTKCTDREILEEVEEDKKFLSKLFNKEIRGMAYSYGTHDDRVVKLLKDCKIKYARTVKNTLNFSIPNE